MWARSGRLWAAVMIEKAANALPSKVVAKDCVGVMFITGEAQAATQPAK